MHKLLARQLKKASRNSADGSIDSELLLELVSAAYEEADKERHLSQHAFGLMSDELQGLNRNLRTEAEARSRVQEQLIDAIGSMRDGFALYDADDRLVLCNENYRSLYVDFAEVLEIGVEYEETLKEFVKRGHIPEAKDREEAWIAKRLADHQNPKGPCELLLSDGRWIRIIERKTQAGGIVGVRTDITERKRTDFVLGGRGVALERLAEGAPLDKVLSVLVETTESAWRDALCSVLLLDADGKRLIHAVAPSLPDFYNEAIDGLEIGDGVGSCGTAAFRGERVIVEDVMDHPYWLEFRDLTEKAGLRACWSEPIFSANGKVLGTFAIYRREPSLPGSSELDFMRTTAHLAGIAIDRKQAEASLVAAMEQARMATRAKSEFLANMSHELRTPLNAIIGFSDMIKDAKFGPVGHMKYMDYANDINSSGLHLLDLITSILDLSKIEAGKTDMREEFVDVISVIDACLTLINERAEYAGITIKKSTSNELKPLFADELKLKQIILNLLSNAIKFTERGGEVTVTARLDAENCFVIDVLDTGIGIAPKDVVRAMEPFGQVDGTPYKKLEGTGLGLPLTLALVELHGGKMELQSEPGVGTHVTVRFPQRVPENAPHDLV